jgi:hypothetical protein
LLLLSGAAYAQNPLTTSAQRYFNTVRRNLEASADAMPADKFGYSLTSGQMTFAAWINHSTQRNYSDCAILKGETAPAAMKTAESLTDKAAVTKALKESFTYCEGAMQGMDDKKAVSTPEVANAFLHLVVHNNEIYGNIVGYMRSSGIVPPSTAARKKK